MKVKSTGIYSSIWVLPDVQCKLPRCYAVMDVNEADIYAPDYEEGFRVRCGVCGSIIHIDEEPIPAKITNELNSKRKYRDSQ